MKPSIVSRLHIPKISFFLALTTPLSVFKTLGLLISFDQVEAGFFQLEHTESRRTEVLLTLENLINLDQCTTKELERLHGRLIWFNSFCFGRTLNVLIRYLSGFAHTASRITAVDGLSLRILKDLKDQLATVEPVQVHRGHQQNLDHFH